MCYDIAQLALRIFKDAKRSGASDDELKELEDKWKKLEPTFQGHYHASGYNHPELVAITSKNGRRGLESLLWGLIPDWVDGKEKATEIWNKTLNARGETIFEKPSFKKAASKRCIIPLDGFYEHYHKKGEVIPHYIQSRSEESLLVGGLVSEWVNPENGELLLTTAIVTTKANELMATIHNNPKLKEPRMPLLINDNDAEQWLLGSDREAQELIIPNIDLDLKSITVSKLRGPKYKGNTPEVQAEHKYEERKDPPTLFDDVE